jgi:hypothetical protein
VTQTKLDKLDAVFAQSFAPEQDAALFTAMLSLPNEGLYFLKGHAEADAHHAEDLYRIIGRTFARPTIASPSSECIMSQPTYTARSWIARAFLIRPLLRKLIQVAK